MGEALTHPIVAPGLTESVEACVDAEFVASMVCACGSVFAGVKPAELFGFSPRGKRFDESTDKLRALAQEAASVYSRGLADSPVRLECLGTRNGRQMLLCWRPEALDGLLHDERTRAFLQQYGFAVTGPDELAKCAAERLSQFYDDSLSTSRTFPHEVGVLLGFPVQDVEGFIANGGRQELACGQWKVYGDVERAKRRFARMARAKQRCTQLSSRGYTVRGLIRDRQARELA